MLIEFGRMDMVNEGNFGAQKFGYHNDVGYMPDGTDMTKAGNLGVQR